MTTGGAHVRDILEAEAEELARAPEGGDDSDLSGRLVIYRSEPFTIWEAVGLREQGCRISSGNFAPTPGEEEAFGTWGGEIPVEYWTKADL